MARRLWQQAEDPEKRQKLVGYAQRQNSTLGDQGYNGEYGQSNNDRQRLFRQAAGNDRQSRAALEVAYQTGQDRMSNNNARQAAELDARSANVKLGVQADYAANKARIDAQSRENDLNRNQENYITGQKMSHDATQGELNRKAQYGGKVIETESSKTDPISGQQINSREKITQRPVNGAGRLSSNSGGQQMPAYQVPAQTPTQPGTASAAAPVSTGRFITKKPTTGQPAPAQAPATAQSQGQAPAQPQAAPAVEPKKKITSGVVIGPYGTVAVDAKGRGGDKAMMAKVNPGRETSNDEFNRTVYDAKKESIDRRLAQNQGVPMGELAAVSKEGQKYAQIPDTRKPQVAYTPQAPAPVQAPATPMKRQSRAEANMAALAEKREGQKKYREMVQDVEGSRVAAATNRPMEPQRQQVAQGIQQAPKAEPADGYRTVQPTRIPRRAWNQSEEIRVAREDIRKVPDLLARADKVSARATEFMEANKPPSERIAEANKLQQDMADRYDNKESRFAKYGQPRSKKEVANSKRKRSFDNM